MVVFCTCGNIAIYAPRGQKAIRCKQCRINNDVDNSRPLCKRMENGVYVCNTRATMGIEGTKKPLFCASHEYGNDGKTKHVDVVNKKCVGSETETCTKIPAYGPPGGKVISCVAHKKSDDWIDLKAPHCYCGKIASYGQKGKRPSRCLIHKDDTFTNTRSRKCDYENCEIQPVFGPPNGSAHRCWKHKLDGYRNLYMIRCSECDTMATFGVNYGEPFRCFAHKTLEMFDVHSTKCQLCDKQPSFGIRGSSADHCYDHKTPEEVNVRCNLCESTGCQKQPGYAPEGNKPIRCYDHKIDLDINIYNKLCKFDKCDGRAIYGLIRGVAKWCSQHKSADMVKLAKSCKLCDKEPFYGLVNGEKEYCADHKQPDCVVIYKRCVADSCTKRRTFGLPGELKIHCKNHAKRGETDKKFPKCQVCGISIAKYSSISDTIPQRCESDKLPTDVNIVDRTCALCGLIDTIPWNQSQCTDCLLFPFVSISKELVIKNLFDKNGINYVSNNKPVDINCSAKRPDFHIDMDYFQLIVEVDEHQHRSYPKECEIIRMMQIQQDLGSERVIFIRYNPDDYIDHMGNKVRLPNGRHETLLNLIHTVRLINIETLPPLGVYYLFYDGFNSSNIAIQQIVY